MSVMEPDLILHPVLERAVPALEALVEVRLLQTFTLDMSAHMSNTDTSYDCGDQGARGCSSCDGLPRHLLPWCQTSVPDPRSATSRN